MMNQDRILEVSDAFWNAMEKADEQGMREYANEDCKFVHIGIACDLDKEISFYTTGSFQPTNLVFHSKDVQTYENLGVVLTDFDYSLLLDGKETTHHFMVTEVYDLNCKLVQFSFIALLH